jgi:tRNA(fMet)-specific endonuclease VapC
MSQYLLDTNIIIFLFKSKHRIHEKIAFVGLENCFISEITLAELKIGAEKSHNPLHNHRLVDTFADTVTVLPISNVLDIFASETIRLEKAGTPIHDYFDILIAATALLHNLTMVTNNVKHFHFFKTLNIEDWVDPSAPAGFINSTTSNP